MRGPDPRLLLQQDEVDAHLGAMRVIDPPGGLPFLRDAALDDPVWPAGAAIPAGIQVAAVQVERPALAEPTMTLPLWISSRPTIRAMAAVSPRCRHHEDRLPNGPLRPG